MAHDPPSCGKLVGLSAASAHAAASIVPDDPAHGKKEILFQVIPAPDIEVLPRNPHNVGFLGSRGGPAWFRPGILKPAGTLLLRDLSHFEDNLQVAHVLTDQRLVIGRTLSQTDIVQ